MVLSSSFNAPKLRHAYDSIFLHNEIDLYSHSFCFSVWAGSFFLIEMATCHIATTTKVVLSTNTWHPLTLQPTSPGSTNLLGCPFLDRTSIVWELGGSGFLGLCFPTKHFHLEGVWLYTVKSDFWICPQPWWQFFWWPTLFNVTLSQAPITAAISSNLGSVIFLTGATREWLDSKHLSGVLKWSHPHICSNTIGPFICINE